MIKEYGSIARRDLDPALERVVTPPVRQVNQQRVLETASTTAAVTASAYRLVLQTMPDGVATLVAWTAEVVDTDTLHDNAVNNSRFTVPAAKPGVYRITSRLSIDVNAGNISDFEIRVLVNGVEVADEVSGAQTTDFVIMITHEQFLNVADYYEIQVLSTGNPVDVKPGSSESYVVVNRQLI